MLKVYTPLVLAVLLVAAPALAEAADTEESERIEKTERKIGLGAKIGVNGTAAAGLSGLGALGLGSGIESPVRAPSAVFSLPVSESFRLEPQFSADVFDNEQAATSGGSGLQSATLDSGWMIDLGTAIHNTWRPFDRTVGYGGVTIGYMQRNLQAEEEGSDGETEEGESSTRSIYGGPVLGAEYLISEAFSVGAEASVELRHSETDTDGDINLLPGNGSGLNLDTRAFFVARMYLW